MSDKTGFDGWVEEITEAITGMANDIATLETQVAILKVNALRAALQKCDCHAPNCSAQQLTASK